MNRRRFFGTLFGLAIAPKVIVKAISENEPALLPFKGKIIWNAGIVYAPYIPMLITPIADIKPMRNSPSGKVFYMDYYTKHTI